VLNTPVGRLRAVALVEGASFLLLLGVAMPLKYLAGMPEAVKVVGWAHGVLFMLFLLALVEVAAARALPWKRIVAAAVASVVPFGPFVLDGHLRRDEQAAPRRV
jgi:integral membrane protein